MIGEMVRGRVTEGYVMDTGKETVSGIESETETGINVATRKQHAGDHLVLSVETRMGGEM